MNICMHLFFFRKKKTHRLCWGCFFFKLQAKTFLLWTFVQFAQSSFFFCENTTESLAFFQVITNKIHSKNQKKKSPPIIQHLHQDSCSLGSDCPSSSVLFQKSEAQKTPRPVNNQIPEDFRPKDVEFFFDIREKLISRPPQKKMLWLSEVKVFFFKCICKNPSPV